MLSEFLENQPQGFRAERHFAARQFFHAEGAAFDLVDAERLQQFHVFDDGIAFLATVIKEFPEDDLAVFVGKLADKTLSIEKIGALTLKNAALEHPETAFFTQVCRIARRQRVDRFQMPKTVEVAVLGTVQFHQSAGCQKSAKQKQKRMKDEG